MRLPAHRSLTFCIMYRLIAPLVGVLGFGFAVSAASFPTKPIRLLVGYSPGGPNDTQARLVGQRLAANLGQPVVVDNRAGEIAGCWRCRTYAPK